MLSYQFIYAIFVLVLFFFLYKVAYWCFGVEHGKSKKIYANAKVKRKKKKNIYYILADFILIPEYKRVQLQRSLDSLNLKEKMTIEEYYSDTILKSLPILIIGLELFLIPKIPQELAILVLGYGIYKAYMRYGRLDRAVKYKRIQIEEEAPTLIRHFLVALKSSFDLEAHFKNYLPFAKYLKTDIELLLADFATMKTDQNNLIFALERFSERCDTPIITDFVSGLINVSTGKNQESYFLMLERDIKELALQNMMRKNQKIDNKIRRVFFVLVFNFMFFLFSDIGTYIVTTLKGF